MSDAHCSQCAHLPYALFISSGELFADTGKMYTQGYIRFQARRLLRCAVKSVISLTKSVSWRTTPCESGLSHKNGSGNMQVGQGR